MKYFVKSRKHLGIVLTLASVVSVFAGCKKNKGGNDDNHDSTPSTDVTDQALIDAIDASNPNVEVVVGDYDHLDTLVVNDVNGISKTFGSSSILDMPKTSTIGIVYNESANSNVKPSSTLLQNIINANKQLHTITVKDRAGKYLERDNSLLSTDGTKIVVEKAGGFDYGEVYQIALNDADYLCFENKDPSIRTLTIEIEDSPGEKDAVYDTKTTKSITNIDVSKVSSKKVKEEGGLYSFEYNGSFPNLAKGAIFYATQEGHPSSKLDFYGIYQSKKNKSDGKVIVFYETPKASDIYNELKLKNVVDMDLSNAEVLITDDVAKKEFKQSALAEGIARAASPYVKGDVKTIINVLSKFSIKFYISMTGNELSMKFVASLTNYKLDSSLYLTVDFNYEKITKYSIDYDVSLETAFVLPVGVDYKIKCIEETDEIFALRAALSLSSFPSPSQESDFTNAILSEIEAIQNNKNASAINAFGKNGDLQPATSGSRASWPVVAVNITSIAPISIRYEADFYIDSAFQALLSFSHQSHSKKINFFFANVGGADIGVENTITKSSSFGLNYAGSFNFEVGLRSSIGFSFLGLYDYLHAEGYAESYTRASLKGLLASNIAVNSESLDFTGFISADALIKCGTTAGLDFKVLIFSYNVTKTLWDFDLLRVKLDNSLEQWSSASTSSISLTKQTTSLDETKVLYFNCFNALSGSFEETKYKADDKYTILSGILWPESLLEPTGGKMFSYEVLSHETDVVVSEDGLIHIKDGSDPEFDFELKVKVNGWCGGVGEKTINVHYKQSGNHELYLKWGDNFNVLAGEYQNEAQVKLPNAPEVEGYKFKKYWIETSDNFKEGDQITMTNTTLTVNVEYELLEAYRVRFYDGDCNLVYEDVVYEGDSATEPNSLMRDRYTDSSKHKFVGWNCKFNKVNSDLDVYGIYMGIEEE